MEFFLIILLMIVGCIYASDDEKCIEFEEFKDLHGCQCYNTAKGKFRFFISLCIVVQIVDLKVGVKY